MYKKTLFTISVTMILIGYALFLWSSKNERFMTFIALDSENFAELPKNFRVMSHDRRLGVSSSASGQFSEAGLEAVAAYIERESRHHSAIWIVDLRQESHGFVNGLPVTWYQDKNNANEGQSALDIVQIEYNLLNAIKLGKSVDLFKIVKGNNGEVSAGKKYSIIAEQVETEEELVRRHGLSYFRLFTLDHTKPDNHDVDRFVEFVSNNIHSRDWLHFHCRGGRGRTSTYLTLLFIIFNAKQMSLDDILLYQQEIGSIDLAKSYKEERKLWKNDLANFRYEFVKDFYRFANDPKGLRQQNWSAWLAQQNSSSSDN